MMRLGLVLVLALACALGFVGWSVAADDKEDKVAAEDKKWEGTWVVVSMEVDGEKMPKEAFANMVFTFTGKKYVQKVGETVLEAGTQHLDPTKTPKFMDIHVTEGETKDTKQLAIYEIDGDEARICAASHGEKDRPSKFETKPGTGHMLFVLKRKK